MRPLVIITPGQHTAHDKVMGLNKIYAFVVGWNFHSLMLFSFMMPMDICVSVSPTYLSFLMLNNMYRSSIIVLCHINGETCLFNLWHYLFIAFWYLCSVSLPSIVQNLCVSLNFASVTVSIIKGLSYLNL